MGGGISKWWTERRETERNRNSFDQEIQYLSNLHWVIDIEIDLRSDVFEIFGSNIE